jgi:hypothetical protein
MNTRKWTTYGSIVAGVSAALIGGLIFVVRDYTRPTPVVILTAMLLASAMILGGCAVIGARMVAALCRGNSEYRDGMASIVDRIAWALREIQRVP